MASRWHRRTFDAVGVTEYPPGPHLAKLYEQKVYVTRPGNDDIGQILASMNVEFLPFSGEFDCSLLFINCGTPDQVDPGELAEFVTNGGCLYASDHADGLLARAFPGVFDFGGHIGSSGEVTAEVLDLELRDVLGSSVAVVFDMGAWAVLRGGRVEPLLEAASGSQHAGLPIMAYAEHGSGSIFFTCFHNRAQMSDREKGLLQLLVVKQFGAKTNQSLERAGSTLGVSISELRSDLYRG